MHMFDDYETHHPSGTETKFTPSFSDGETQQETVEKKEQRHPMAAQYIEQVRGVLSSLKNFQEHGWKDTEQGWKLPEYIEKEIEVMACTTEIMLQMIAEELMPDDAMDTELYHKVSNADLATADGRFFKKGIAPDKPTIVQAMRIDDVPDFADEDYLTKLGETAQLDLLLRDVYSRFLANISFKLETGYSVGGSYEFRRRLIYELANSHSVKAEKPVAFGAEEQGGRRLQVHGVGGQSQLEKFLAGNKFALLENNNIVGDNRTLYIDTFDTKDCYALRDHIEPSPKEFVLPLQREKIFSLDYIRQAASEVQAETLGKEAEPTELKLGVKYRTDAASGVRYAPGSSRAEEQENMRMGVGEFAFIKERMRKHLEAGLSK